MGGFFSASAAEMSSMARRPRGSFARGGAISPALVDPVGQGHISPP